MKDTIIILTTLFLMAGTQTNAQKDELVSVNQLVIIANHQGPVISKDIYGHFSEHLGNCIYGGLWVGTDSKIPNTYGIRNDVLFALREIKVPNLRWPGGCFADTYHWKDGVGPKEKRASIINTNWGGVIPMTKRRKENGREEPWKVKYFAIGNENWGCGGNMTDEFYSNTMKQYSTFLGNYSGNQLYRVACGPSDYNFAWTETLMKDAGTRAMFQGLSIHYYSVVDGWGFKGSATKFDEREWFETMRLNLQMDFIIKGHSDIMDRYDPQKTKGLVVDEWGNWFNVEPGTNPGFLYQQNTMRDAITAAIHLNIFNQHADRVKAANLAQMVNVLQSVILTKDDKMVLTPTYWVFRMFRVHQEAKLINLDLRCEDYVYGSKKIPAISASASVDKDGKVHISLANLNPNKPITITCQVIGDTFKKVTGEVLTAKEMNSFNSFESPETVKPAVFNGFTLKDGILSIVMPSKSVVVLELIK